MSVRSYAAAERRDPAGVVGRAREAERSRLDLGFDAPVGQELEPIAVEIHVAVVRVRAPLHVGRIADATLEPLRAALDHREVDRRVLGMRGVRIDLRLHAREIARRVQAPHVLIQGRDAVRLAGAIVL